MHHEGSQTSFRRIEAPEDEVPPKNDEKKEKDEEQKSQKTTNVHEQLEEMKYPESEVKEKEVETAVPHKPEEEVTSTVGMLIRQNQQRRWPKKSLRSLLRSIQTTLN